MTPKRLSYHVIIYKYDVSVNHVHAQQLVISYHIFYIEYFMFLQAAILQHTADYIYQLEQEKTRLLSQNCQLKRLVSKQEGELLSTASVHKKRKIDDSTGKYAMASFAGWWCVWWGADRGRATVTGGYSVRREPSTVVERGSTTRGKVAAPAGYYVYIFYILLFSTAPFKLRIILLHRHIYRRCTHALAVTTHCVYGSLAGFYTKKKNCIIPFVPISCVRSRLLLLL